MYTPTNFVSTFVKMTILQGGRVLRSIEHDDQMFLEAPPEGNYEIVLQNSSGERLMVIPSVDGLNVLNGESASVDGPGYVLMPYQTITVNGWHRTSSETAAFVFAPAEGGSYSDQIGKGTSNVGVIGAAVFREKLPERWRETKTSGGLWLGGGPFRGESFGSRAGDEHPRGMQVNSSSYSAESGMGATKSVPTRSRVAVQDIGTGYGEKLEMHTTTTTFVKRTQAPEGMIQYRYATGEVLRSWGVPVDRPMPPPAPSAFPESVGVKAPAGWRG